MSFDEGPEIKREKGVMRKKGKKGRERYIV